jgi:hypothetical protein
MKPTTAPQTSLIPFQLDSLRRRLERWRRNRKHRTPIPEEIWASAAGIAGEYGLARTARTLRLDYYSLKERVSAHGLPISPEGGAQPAFVEFVPQVPATVSECAIELEDRSGARMRIHIKGSAIPNVIGLSDAFWRTRR